MLGPGDRDDPRIHSFTRCISNTLSVRQDADSLRRHRMAERAAANEKVLLSLLNVPFQLVIHLKPLVLEMNSVRLKMV